MNERMDSRQVERDLQILEHIERNPNVTQAILAMHLDVAVGSVNWYIKRLVQRGWLKVSHLDRTRLKYDLTSEGMQVFTQRALLYARDSLKVYREMRNKAKETARRLEQRGVKEVFLPGDDEMTDIMRLTCMESGIAVRSSPGGVIIQSSGTGFQTTFPNGSTPPRREGE